MNNEEKLLWLPGGVGQVDSAKRFEPFRSSFLDKGFKSHTSRFLESTNKFNINNKLIDILNSLHQIILKLNYLFNKNKLLH